uniref:Uncharacterized protein n=1 Tax=Dracunculus medinensis TaxID=318479 RepID=A0A0N4UR59_DRAME
LQNVGRTTIVIKKFFNSSEDEEGDFLMNIDNLENAERLNFDFEAYPLIDSDKDGIISLLTAPVDLNSLADKLINLFNRRRLDTAEEFADEDGEDLICGKYAFDIWDLLKSRVHKYIEENIINQLIELFNMNYSVGLLINERFLYFPPSIAAPAFNSLKNDMKAFESFCNFTTVLLIIKIRIAEAATVSSQFSIKKKGKKMGKVAKKRAAAAFISDSDVIYGNAEEELGLFLIQAFNTIERQFLGIMNFDYFQYPVHSEVEKESKFGSFVVSGVIFWPYRRICFLNNEQFKNFVDNVSILWASGTVLQTHKVLEIHVHL